MINYLLLFAIIYKNLIFCFIIISVFENECQFAENDEGKTHQREARISACTTVEQ